MKNVQEIFVMLTIINNLHRAAFFWSGKHLDRFATFLFRILELVVGNQFKLFTLAGCVNRYIIFNFG